MNILVINSGSSSIKYQLFSGENPHRWPPVSSNGSVNRRAAFVIGAAPGMDRPNELWKTGKSPTISKDWRNDDRPAAGRRDRGAGCARRRSRRWGIVWCMGVNNLAQPTVITAVVKETIRQLIPLAPLHNPANLTGIEVAEKLFPTAVQVAIFDTAFHQTMPAQAYRYAVPNYLYDEHGVRVYGFHGTSHQYVSRQAAEHWGKRRKRPI
jgi:acetate kinase